ncbi:MAG TPA: PadR family transcriptional regulator [Bryobacteraceae bacterium]|nr:PadR family transcriptional regulator [Bryobacteraceae bacterium]
MDLLQGTLDMLVLRTLRAGALHGYGIAKNIRSTSNDALDIEFGSLYPALKRLEAKGWIASGWEMSDHNRRAKYYKLTAAGRKQLAREHSKWADFVSAVGRIMGSLPEVKG